MTTDHKPQTGTLAEFLLARIAEDETAANASVDKWNPAEWHSEGGGIYAEGRPINPIVNWVDHDDAAPHIARWDPARVLAECEARRSIVAEYQATGVEQLTHEESVGVWLAMKALASVYADHPDYVEDWKQ